MTPPRDPDSGRGRVRRAPSISDTIDVTGTVTATSLVGTLTE